MKKFIYIFIIILINTQIYSQPLEFIIQGAYQRNSLSLNGKWNYIVDPYECGYYNYRYQPYDEIGWRGGYYEYRKPDSPFDLIEYSFDNNNFLNVPGDWNTQYEKLFYYEGTIWYKKSFDILRNSNKRYFLYFAGANYEKHVYLNGKKLGKHEGGFTPFIFEITDYLKDRDNFLIVKVDNKRKREGVPTLNTDWFNYGGITRDVFIIETPETFIQDYKIELRDYRKKIIGGYIKLNGSEKSDVKINLSIPELKRKIIAKTNKEGVAIFEEEIKDIKFWSPNSPKLYIINITTEKDTITDKIGFRKIEVKGANILINGQPIFLKGICIHEENPIRANRAFCIEDARMLLTWVKELNGNFARLAHYPHNEYMAKIADELGILLWEEIPVYWTIDWKNEYTYNLARKQLIDLIERDKNRASVIIWSVGNETPINEDRNKFMISLINTAKKLDSTRLISAALEQHALKDKKNVHVVDDPLIDYTDIISFNEYIGWYDGLPDKCLEIEWQIDKEKPVIISEFGGGALQGFHGDKTVRWTEEFQEDLYIKTLKMLSKIKNLRGITPWVLADFRSPRRNLSGIQDGWNRKGLIGSETGTKKKAFYVLKDFYNTK